MKLLTDRLRIFRLRSCLLLVVALFMTGCAATPAPRPAGVREPAVQKSEQTPTIMAKGDITNAVEELKIALAIDPDNAQLRAELASLIAKRDQQAAEHLKAGMALRSTNPKGAQKEFLRALRIRNDYPEAVAALRALQLASSIDMIQGRLKKEARKASSKADQEQAADEDTGDYSLDIAISALEDGDFTTAIREFEKMKALYPHDPDIRAYLDKARYNSGKAYFIKMEYNKALSEFTKVSKGYENVNEYIAKCRQALKKAGRR